MPEKKKKSSSSSGTKKKTESKPAATKAAPAESKPAATKAPAKGAEEEPPAKKKGGVDLGKTIGYEDMTTMENMTLDGVLENLQDRYAEDLVYTYTSSILVAINPYKRLPIYTDKHVKAYKGVRLGKLPPHIFAVAESAYNMMIQHQTNQSVLVSGESGAGKTESTKLILQFLSARTGRASNIEKMVLASVPVLEAMGNAKTGRNDNSSRFGKLIKIQFNEDYYICGSTMSTYLLEKSRLIFQAPGERNFHIFYQMTRGMKEEEKKKYFIKNAEHYNYINKSGCYDVAGVAEEDALQEFREALALFDINEELESQMFRILAAVLHLGNICFKGEGEGSVLDGPGSEEELKITAELLGIQPKDLLFAISNKEIKLRTEIINKPLTADQARDQTDALAKHLYSVLFDWLVTQLNACTHADKYHSFIGVLDIFGFEVFVKNSMEQFLINFANEKLQQFFNHQIFKLEQKIYEEEKIDWTVIEFKDNQECLDLIEQKRPPGIIAILDEESRFPRATDLTFVGKLTDNLKNHKHFGTLKLVKTKFIVKHFAGEVDYDVTGWLDKNKDELPAHMIKIIGASENMFTAILYSPDDLPDPTGVTGKSPMARRAAKEGGSAGGGGDVQLDFRGGANKGATSPRGAAAGNKKTGSKETLGTQFKNQLQSLMDLLAATEPYFIRCVKPNPEKVPNNFNRELIYNQLLYAGMLETIRIRRMGYPIRWLHTDFFKRFRVICPEVAMVKDMKAGATRLAEALKINMPYGGQIGLTKVFLKQEVANDLEDRRNHALTHIIKLLQLWWKMVSTRGHFIEYRQNSVVLQQWWRMACKRKHFVKTRKSSLKVQCWWRMLNAKKELARLREKKRKEEEERLRKEEEERQRRIKKYGEEQVRKEEELKAKMAAEQDEAEREKIRMMLEGDDKKDEPEEKKKKKKKRKKKAKLSRTGSIMMDRNEVVEVPINVDGKMTVGLGWKGRKYEMDASCLMFRYKSHSDDVYKFKPRSKDGAVIHKVGWSGSLSLITSIGQSESDIHQIDVNLKKLSNKINTLIFIVTLFTSGANFSEIEDSYCRLIDSGTKEEYCRYTIEASGKETAKIMCKLYRYGYTAWRLKAIGHPSQGRLFKHMVSRVSPFLDPQPPKRKFKIKIHKAKLLDNNKRKMYTKEGTSGLNTFCETRFDLDSARTRVVKKSLKPTWNTSHDVSGCATTIEVAVWHKKGFNKQFFVARTVIECAEGSKMNIKEQWFNFEDEEASTCGGQIQLSITE